MSRLTEKPIHGQGHQHLGLSVAQIKQLLAAKRLLPTKGILNIAVQMPSKIPTEKQCAVLLGAIEEARAEGISIP